MLHHVILADELLAALLASVWFFAAMQTQMPSQIGFVIELLRTLLALERLLTGMLFEVHLMGVDTRKAFATPLALEGLLTAVESFVMLS